MVAKKIHFFTKLFICFGGCGCVILFEKKMCKRQIAIKERPLIVVVCFVRGQFKKLFVLLRKNQYY